ncbi:hypothetical protein EV183_000194 [Coemansia sp. RSA 2336]|nr:hypothetical protein EV183_000194 [Coemansia sp. RSA 2336]
MSMTVSELPHKEQTLFRQTLKLYEARQYKKGLKVSEQILKKFPDHGETLAVKGLFLTHVGRKDEGYQLIDRGIEINPRSSISWHMYGIVCRNDQKNDQAIKCYEEAIKADSDNMHILRELAALYTQGRLFTKVVEIRERLVKLNPTFPMFWMGLAVAYHLTGRYDLAIKVISAHESGKNEPPLNKLQISELVLYKNSLMELNGDYQQALEHLKEIRPQITDVTAWKEQKAKLLLKIDRKEAAATAYQDLIARNAENNEYIVGYLACNGLDISCEKDEDAVIEVIDTLRQQFPSSNRLRFLPLTFTTGDNFSKAAASLVKYALRKGIPSLFSSLKALYAEKWKAAALGTLVEGYATQIRDTQRFSDSTEDEPSSVLMWCQYYLAQHYDYHGEYERALTLIEEAVRLAPKIVEPYMIKAKLLKHAGDFRGARDTMDFARQLDLGDRYINSKCVKYMLRNNEPEEAEKTFLMFIRDDAPHLVQETLEIQAIWYMCERGHAFRRQGDIGRALKHYHQAIASFDTYYQDQMDFHSYSIRKGTLRTYVDIIEWEGTVYSHPIYQDAARSAIECYAKLADLRTAGTPFTPIVQESDSRPLTRNGSSQQGQHNLSAGIGETKVYDVDKDPNGTEFVNSDSLAEALKLVEQLEKSCDSASETHMLAFEVHLRMQKYFLVLKSINALKAIDAEHPALPSMVTRLNQALDTDDSFAAPLKGALKSQVSKAFGSTAIDAGTDQSLAALLIAAKGMLAMGQTHAAQAKDLLMKATDDKYADQRTLLRLLEAKQLLEKCNASESDLAQFSSEAKRLYTLATCF